MISGQAPATPHAQSHPVLPWDAHNQALVANVHPAEWINPTPDGRYNLVVIGETRPAAAEAMLGERPELARLFEHVRLEAPRDEELPGIAAAWVDQLPAAQRAHAGNRITMLRSWNKNTRRVLPLVVKLLGG